MYTDSDWVSNDGTRRSTTEVLVIMAGDPVNWISKLQPIVTVSSKEAEYLHAFMLSRISCGSVSCSRTST